MPESAFMPKTGEFRSGWPLLLVTAVALMCAPSTMPVYTLGVFVEPLEQAFGWGRREIQTAILFSTGFGAICAPAIGELVERYGSRAVVLPAFVGMAIGCAAAAAMTGALWQFYGAYALMAVLGAGVGPIAWSRLVAGEFERNRGLALGIALSGTGLCAAFMPNYAAYLIESQGWRFAYLGMGAFALLVALPLAYWLVPKGDHRHVVQKSRHSEIAVEGITLRGAVQGRHFWLLAASIILIYFSIAGAIPNLVPALTDHGVSRQAAASIMAVFGISIIFGRIIVGGLVDRFWAPGVAVAVLVPAVGACLLFNAPLEFKYYVVAGALLGIATGMEFDILAFLTARYFGLINYARIYSILYAILAAVAGLAPMVFGVFYDHYGNYEAVFIIAAASLALGGLLLLPMGAYPSFSRKTNLSESK
jgi:MFS family permease